MSAAITRNMSVIMGQPSELTHRSTSQTEASSFLELHSHYSFIAVVALMSFFLVVTVSATGLLLAFCRKKNSVFTLSPKPGTDSQFEMDDMDSSDVEVYRKVKGECYIHLSDEYDNDDEEQDDDHKFYAVTNGKGKEYQIATKTLPQSQNAITTWADNRQEVSNVLTPLIRPVKTVNICSTPCGKASPASYILERTSATQQRQQLWHCYPHRTILWHPPGGRPDSCHMKPPQTHHRAPQQPSQATPSGHRVRVYRTPRSRTGTGKLHRSHTIHTIPQTARTSHFRPAVDKTTQNDGKPQTTSQPCQNTKTKLAYLDTPLLHAESDTLKINYFKNHEYDAKSKTSPSFAKLKPRPVDDYSKENDKNDYDLKQATFTAQKSPPNNTVRCGESTPAETNKRFNRISTENTTFQDQILSKSGQAGRPASIKPHTSNFRKAGLAGPAQQTPQQATEPAHAVATPSHAAPMSSRQLHSQTPTSGAAPAELCPNVTYSSPAHPSPHSSPPSSSSTSGNTRLSSLPDRAKNLPTQNITRKAARVTKDTRQSSQTRTL